ncbi:MAG TPA: hypothetical protein VKX25_07845 [Bryobacteraceae bacterium]|jgi:hypothetical protein|nr:hypothetical protein [Bryobacteraceae bacterium]
MMRWLAFFAAVGAALAHNGPPFPILSDYRMGPCVISLWTHPDVGTGTFFVLVGAAPGQQIPKDLTFEIGVLPVSGRLKEQRYPTERSVENGELRYDAAIPFDRQEKWRIHLYLKSSVSSEMATTTVEVTPPGLGAWDLLLFSWPFFGFGAIWLLVLKKRREKRLVLKGGARRASAVESATATRGCADPNS